MQLATSKTNSPQLYPELLEKNYFLETSNIQSRKTFTSLQPFGQLSGVISLGNLSLPNQRFSLQQKDNLIIFQNYPMESFPSIKIVLERKNFNVEIREFAVERSESSIKGELLYTRLFLMLSEIRKFSLHFKNVNLPPFEFSFNELSSDEEYYMLQRAKLSRKLRFLEWFFKTTFTLPEEFDGNDIRQIEILFRAVTEGEFSVPAGDSITIFNYKPDKEDLQNGSNHRKKEFNIEFNEDLMVLGKFIPTGKMRFRAEKAAIANPRVLKNYKKNAVIPSLQLNIYDYQIHHRFEKYTNSQRLLRNKQKLEQFKDNLRKEESEFLVELLDEPLSREMTDKIAVDIIEGLLQYHDFPDRFSVLEPSLEKNKWRVPIALTYPKYEPIWLADAFVDVRTGKVEMKASFDALLKKGKKKAKELFSAV